MKRSNGLGRAIRLGVLVSATALLVPGIAACSFNNPQTIATPYSAAEGSDGAITNPDGSAVELRDFLLVGSEQGGPATMIGAVVNQGTTEVRVDLTVTDGTTTVGTGSVTAAPGVLTKIGPDDEAVSVTSLPTAPGSVLKLQAQTGAGGVELSLPVLAAQGPYAGIAP